MMTNHLYVSDCRRATALVTHYGRGNLAGINEALREAVEVDRVTPLLMAVLDLYDNLMPVLVAPLGMKCIADTVAVTAREAEDDELRRAAQLVGAHASSDVDAMNAVLMEAKQAERITQLFFSVMILYGMLVPAIYTRPGLHALQQVIVDLAAVEAENEANE
jgi:hypothetical protein